MEAFPLPLSPAGLCSPVSTSCWGIGYALTLRSFGFRVSQVDSKLLQARAALPSLHPLPSAARGPLRMETPASLNAGQVSFHVSVSLLLPNLQGRCSLCPLGWASSRPSAQLGRTAGWRTGTRMGAETWPGPVPCRYVRVWLCSHECVCGPGCHVTHSSVHVCISQPCIRQCADVSICVS